MRVIKLLFILNLTVLLFFGCVERYYASEDDVITGTLVVSAHLTDKPGEQVISISRSEKLRFPSYVPETGCWVVVEDQVGNSMEFKETVPGDYSVDIPALFLVPGSLYRLLLMTSDGNRYESEYSRLRSSTSINSVYYELESIPTYDPLVTVHGIRFYMDFDVDPDSSEYMRWELLETYEFHNPPYEDYIYGFDRQLKLAPDSLVHKQCWITAYVNAIFTLDAGKLTTPQFNYMPLHHISNETQRLSHGYSLLVRQFSMDEPAFRYWDELKKNTQENSGLYSRQPSITPSNICNCDDPEEKILGFFSISGVSEKRLFVKEVEGLEKYSSLYCVPALELPRFRFLAASDLPIFLSRVLAPEYLARFGETTHECIDCRVKKGSVGDPPDFWPTE